MKETKTVEVHSYTEVNGKPYFANVYAGIDAELAEKLIKAGATEVKAPPKNTTEEPTAPTAKSEVGKPSAK